MANVNATIKFSSARALSIDMSLTPHWDKSKFAITVTNDGLIPLTKFQKAGCDLARGIVNKRLTLPANLRSHNGRTRTSLMPSAATIICDSCSAVLSSFGAVSQPSAMPERLRPAAYISLTISVARRFCAHRDRED